MVVGNRRRRWRQGQRLKATKAFDVVLFKLIRGGGYLLRPRANITIKVGSLFSAAHRCWKRGNANRFNLDHSAFICYSQHCCRCIHPSVDRCVMDASVYIEKEEKEEEEEVEWEKKWPMVNIDAAIDWWNYYFHLCAVNAFVMKLINKPIY